MEPREPSAPPPLPPSPHEIWARASLWLGIVLIVVAAGVLMFRACVDLPVKTIHKAGETIDKATDALATVAAAFNRGTVTTSFISFATTITNSQRLQFATLKQVEIFTRTEEPSTAFGYVPLPDIVVEARAPVEYTYYLDLKAPWRFEIRDNIIVAFVPSIHANRPSIDVSGLTYEVKKGGFKTAEAVENLKKSISSLVILRAKDNVPLVRETGRREAAEFIEKWLARSFSDGKSYLVKVYFPGETPPDRIQVSPGPTH